MIIPEIILVGIHVPYVKGYIVSQNEWQVKTFLLFQLPIYYTIDQSITIYIWISKRNLTWKMTSGFKDVETLVSANSPFQDSFHLDDQIPPRLKQLDLLYYVDFLFSLFHIPNH